MDLNDPHSLEIFLSVYGTLPRAGPGGDEHTLRALSLVPGETPQTVLDLGCGPGAQTLALARALPGARILAVDVVPSMVAETGRRIREAGLEGRVTAEVGDMAAPPVDPGSQQLIWCEGAIYFLGVAEALETWRPLLADGASIAFTEATWFRPSPPAELRDWWLAQYPGITDEAGVRAAVGEASFCTVDSFQLPAGSWWDGYYRPMLDRIDELRSRLPNDPVATDVAAAAEAEIEYFRRFSDWYGYTFFIVQPAR
jgi:SAM-dependent methyltransferase